MWESEEGSEVDTSCASDLRNLSRAHKQLGIFNVKEPSFEILQDGMKPGERSAHLDLSGQVCHGEVTSERTAILVAVTVARSWSV